VNVNIQQADVFAPHRKPDRQISSNAAFANAAFAAQNEELVFHILHYFAPLLLAVPF
jgi:hypothetical protein